MKVTGKRHSTAPYTGGDLVIPLREEAPDLLKSNGNKRSNCRKGTTRNPKVKLVASTGRRSRPETPLLKWKIEGRREEEEQEDEEEEEKGRRRRRRSSKGGGKPVSARKLAAGLCRLQVPEAVGGGGGRRTNERLGFQSMQPGANHVGIALVPHRNGKIYGGEVKDPLHSPSSVSGGRSRFLCKLEPSLQFPNSTMEGATKWDPVCLEHSDEVRQIYGHMKRIDQQVSAVSVVARLEAELEQARARVQELETERRSSKKKLEHFLKKVSEERAAWRSREHEKVRAFIADVKSDLSRERKNRQRLEVVNSKLVNELADAKVSAKRFMQDYEKERKTRELIEEVCDELAKEIAEVEVLKKESIKFREEVDEERKMLQMAEVWREERVQMKLIDAKVALEEKYSQMNKLVADLENFLRSRNATPDLKEIREAESLLRAAASVNIQDIKDFKYEPPNPDDMLSVFEDVNFGEPNEREIEPCATYSPASPASKIHTVSPEVNVMKNDANSRHSNAFIDQNGDLEDDESGWETVSHLEDQGSSYSLEGSPPSVNKNCRASNVSGSGTEWEEHGCNETPINDISELYSVPTKHLKKVSSIARLWRSGPNYNGDNYTVISVDGVNGRLSNGRKSNGSILSPDLGSGKGGLSPTDLVDHWSSPESGNVTRAMKGCIEWPRGIQKASLKSKLLEARMESQKVQLRHVLKQKI